MLVRAPLILLRTLAVLALLVPALARPASAYESPERGDEPLRQVATVFDPPRRRLLLVATSEDRQRTLEVWARSLADSGAWSRLAVAGQPPSGRLGASAVYDPDRDRVLLFGGIGAPRMEGLGLHDETWALNLSGRPEWQPVRVREKPAPPPGRYDHAAVYDRVRHRMIVMGGCRQTQQRDTWALDLAGAPRWSKLDERAPDGFGYSAVVDTRRDRIVTWGGLYRRNVLKFEGGIHREIEESFVAEVWTRSLADTGVWRPVECGGDVQARVLHAAVYDSLDDRMLTFGGECNGVSDDLRVLDLATFEWRTVEAMPPWPVARVRPLLVLEPSLDGRLVVAAGIDADGRRLMDCQALSLNAAGSWSALPTRASSPGARYGATLIVDAAHGRVLLFGGSDGLAPRNDVWARSLAADGRWVELRPGGTPPPRQDGLVGVLDTLRQRVVVVGGVDTTGRARAAWSLALGDSLRWEPLAPTGAGPAFCRSPAAVLAGRHHLVLCPGGGASEVWALSLGNPPVWQLVQSPDRGAGELSCPSLVYDPRRDRVLVFGGEGRWSSMRSDTWALTLRGMPRWSRLLPEAKVHPSARHRHAAAYDPVRDRMIVVGGGPDDRSYGSDVWALRLGEPAGWDQLFGNGALCDRLRQPALVYDPAGDRLLLFGGSAANDDLLSVPLARR